MKKKLAESFFNAALQGGSVVCVFVKPVLGTQGLPEHLLQQEAVVMLKYGLGLPVPTYDARASEAFGITASLSFNRLVRPTIVPWENIVAIIVDDCVSLSLLRSEENVVEAPPKRPSLRAIKGGA